MDTDIEKEAVAVTPAPLAAMWRRYVAFLADWIILSLGGYIVGMLLFDPLVRLGLWTRVIGVVIATVYFGIFDSGWGGAGSPGKKMLGIRVVDDGGRVLGPIRSVVRAAQICAPFMLTNLFPVEGVRPWGALALNGLIGGWMAATLYVLIFNRGTKQGLHDLATRTFVVHGRATRQGLATYTFWQPHIVIAVAFVALSVPAGMAGLPMYMHFAPGSVSAVTSATPVPDTGPVRVLDYRLTWKLKTSHDEAPPECLTAQFRLAGTGVDDESLARSLTMKMIAHYHCRVVTNLTVRMQYGFDLGFSSGTRFRDFVIDEADLTRSP
jgi:uncharacterized RDD family membrane protein YckC